MANVLLGITLTTEETGATPAWTNPANANDDSTLTTAFVGAGVYSPGVSYLVADLGATYDLTSAELDIGSGGPGGLSVETAPDGSTWTERVAATDWSATNVHTFAFTATARYVRLAFTHGGGYGGTNAVGEWRIFGTYAGAPADPDPPPDYVPPAPAGPLLEIWTADPDSYRWGVALWGQATWATAGWQDVTPEGVTADVAWGSQDSADGILARTQAGLWTITTYDPDRILDPSNPASVFYPELVPDLPIRISHRTTVLRTGLVERIEYSFADHRGIIRATDSVKDAQALVPEASVLGDTLYERIADAISAAGIGLVLVTDVHDTPVAGQPDGELTVWAQIQNVAEETARIAWIGRAGELILRRWTAPLERGRRLDAPYLTDVLAIIDDAGRYSVVRALDEDGVTTTERAVTPTPRYGKRVYSRSRMTIDSGDWCSLILSDRATPEIVYQPGDVRPITAADVEYFGTIEAGELVTIDTDEIDAQDGIVLGGRLRVLHRGGELPAWRFTFAVARRGASSLVDDETGATLVSDTDSSDPLIAD